ncbi:hypothetical protein B0T36_19790 [Nocardia donostiensis]|nr:hypothetical protein B0T36_19790 [Nocardia donostiensis]
MLLMDDVLHVAEPSEHLVRVHRRGNRREPGVDGRYTTGGSSVGTQVGEGRVHSMSNELHGLAGIREFAVAQSGGHDPHRRARSAARSAVS